MRLSKLVHECSLVRLTLDRFYTLIWQFRTLYLAFCSNVISSKYEVWRIANELAERPLV
jgi:hypothetical protein